MNLPYYPGCTLKTNAKNFEDSAMRVMEVLDYPLKEMENWVCCGTVFSMTSDDLMLQLGAIRNLLRAEEQNLKELIVLCSMCYNTLKRAKQFITEDEENLNKVNDLMYKENIRYKGTVDIHHLLSILRDRVTFDAIKEKVKKPLSSLKIGGYYGCFLVRPKEFAIDDFEDPSIIEDLLTLLGADGIEFPYRLECCGAYQTVTKKDVTAMRTYEIINSARRAGCEAIVTSCPLCAFNLDQRQKETAKEFVEFEHIPVFYFTELMSIALGCGWDENWTKLHYVNPEPLLKEKGLI
ncbi:MAG: CoB--CoM heterodisulfide reductase iron-sulfur subunit B family protein [Candidatus Cloacimonadota bacterium]|nr:CoB--CoM heterodisulfide reductase iron-sulfur subunit B family protein [Candidatus Cloacimonadota bacterium]